jgi:hypothetical protein
MNGVKIRGWLLSPKVVSLSPPDGDTKNDSNGPDVSTGSTISTENERNKILEDFKVQDESPKEISKRVETMETVET